MEFRLLGPFELWRQGRRLEIGGTKRRALLAVLLLHANEVATVDCLIDAAWPEGPPAGASNALQAHVAALRRALEPDRAAGKDSLIVTRASGYLLHAAPEQLDIARFEQLVRRGRAALSDDPRTAAEWLREALDLWRGPALADFIFEPFAQAEAARLEELRLVAWEWRTEAELALGHHAELVPELEAAVASRPLREGVAAQLMLALYRAGRQAEATRVYDATRAVLVEELGIDPGPALRELHRRILDQDPALFPASAGATGSPPRPQAATHNLPVELTSFVGREAELEELAGRLAEARLLTLTGAGGSGKTRLALRLARDSLGHYPDGVWLVELAPLADPALVAKSAAAALGVREEPGPLLETLQRRLSGARALVVLDNCEHLIQACAELAHGLLTACEGVRILATSREALNVSGEVAWPVPGLSLPDERTDPAPERLKAAAAVRLFVERARARQPGFALDAGNASDVAELCRRLDGTPLAIELAAARVPTLSPAEILRRLDDRFGLLRAGSRTAVARQQTLRATVDWSHDLLGRRERVLFRRLAVFAGGWSLADAEQVCADGEVPAAEVLDLLDQLVSKSLVVSEPVAGRSTRYRLLETLRDYATERLVAAREEEPVRRRHLHRFLGLAERVHEQKTGTRSDGELAELAREQDNLRAALEFARSADRASLLRLAVAMEQLWLAGNIAEGRRWLDEALAVAPPEASVERARALHAAGWLADIQQDHAGARQLVAESLALASRLGDRVGEAWAHLTLGLVELTAENVTASLDHLARSLELHEALGDRRAVWRARIYQAVARTLVPASHGRGRADLEALVMTAGTLDDGWGVGFGTLFLGLADIDAGEPAAALAHLTAALLNPAIGPIRAGGMEGLAELAAESNPLRALRLLGAAAALRQRHAGRPPPFVKRRAAAIRARAEERVTAPAAERAWGEGFAMSTEEAIAYALGASPAGRDALAATSSAGGAPSPPQDEGTATS